MARCGRSIRENSLLKETEMKANRFFKLAIAGLVCATALFMGNSVANAQLFRMWSCGGCANGSCATGYRTQYQWGNCQNGACTGGSCAVTSNDESTKTEVPDCQNGACSIQAETATYDLADKVEMTYTRANIKCVQCGIMLDCPLKENAVYECTNCRKQYAVKEGEIYDIVKTSDAGYKKADVVGKMGEKNSLIGALLQRVNATRARYGLCALAQDSNLESQSFNQAVYCARAGYLWHGAGAAEILAMNWQGFETAINQWLNSPPHRSLLLNGGFRFAGVATYRDGYGRVWCAVRFR